jgi:hypothetical protein
MATPKQVKRRGRLSLILGAIVATVLFAAVAYADNLQSDLNTTTGGLDKTVDLGTLPASSAQSQDVFLFVDETSGAVNNPSYPFSVSGSKDAASTFTGSTSFSGVTISAPGTANGQSGQVAWTTPAAQATEQTYTIVEKFSTAADLNTNPATVTITFKIAAAPSDTTPPVITPNVSGTLGTNGWYTSNVTVSWSVVDNESAISSSTGCGSTTISSNTSGTTLTCSATSAGGTSSESVTIKRDASPPSVSVASVKNADDTVYTPGTWTNQDVTVDFSCTDNGPSGVATLTPDPVTKGEGENQSASTTCTDNAGNSANGSVSDIDVDKTAPVLSCNAASFLLNQPAAQVSAAVSDSLSGPASTPVYGSADTSSVGTKTVLLTGFDNAGNSSSRSCSYTVGYAFDGLYAPVDRPNTMNVSKAGQAIPLKWRLTDYNGAPVLSGVTVTVKAVSASCALGTTTDLVEEYAAGASGLQNLGDGYYQFNWKTPTSYASSCKNIGLDLGEGSVRSNLALFSFKK